MSAATFRISFSAPELSTLEKNAEAHNCKADYKARHFLVGSTDAIVGIFLRSRAGELPDVKIRGDLCRIIADRKRSIELYRSQKKEKQLLYRKGSDLTSERVEQLFIEFYTRRKAHIQQKIPLRFRIEEIVQNIQEQGPGLKRIFGKREGLLRRKSLPMHISISLYKSRAQVLSIAAIKDIAGSGARYIVEMEAELRSLKSRKVYLRDRLLEAIEYFPADADDAIPAFQKIVRENRELDALQLAIGAVAKRLIDYRKEVGLEF